MNAAGRPWLRIFTPFAVGYFLSYLLRNANAVISPDLTQQLSFSPADLGLLTAAYLLAFGLFQLPLGILLDHYGPRRVEAALLLFCAAGCALFAIGDSLLQLTLARALIGLGVSACLMASFKAFSMWFAPQRQASLNASIMAVGGLGALAASSPLGALLPLLGWRGVFAALSVLTLLTAALILSTPEKPQQAAFGGWRRQLTGLAAVFSHRAFWRFAPQASLVTGGFMAMQGLWAAPWMMTVDGFGRQQAGNVLLLMAAAQIGGFLFIAFFVNRLERAGLPPQRLLMLGVACGLLASAALVFSAAPAWLLWPVLGLVFSVGNLAYAVLGAAFPLTLAGRVNTALNLGVFIGAFGVQWLFGVMVEMFTAFGFAGVAAWRASFAIFWLLQAAAWLWFVMAGGRERAKMIS